MAVAEKRPLDDNVYSSKHIVLDIEGTTTSISFVKDTLFPYVRKNLDAYLKSHWDDEEFKSVLALLKDQAAEDKKAALEGAVEIPSDGSEDDLKAAVVKNILWQMDGDKKTTALKKLQGQMWRQGYKTGELKGHLFADVAPAIKEWSKDGRKLYVYSSGSVEAQKLLFGYSAEGDLTEFFTDFFDTAVGAKVDAESYKSIVKKLDCSADDVLFLTDLPKEASAAREAGLPVVLVEREGNEPIASELRKEYSAVSSFGELSFESSTKKQKVNDEVKEPVEESTPAMEVDPVEEVKESKVETKAEVPEIQAEAMDVDKPEEPKVEESSKPAADSEVSKDVVKSQENGTVEEKSDVKNDVSNTEDKSQDNGIDEKSDSKTDAEVPKSDVVEKDEKTPAEKPKEVSVNAEVSENSDKKNAEVPSPVDEVEEKPSEVAEKVEVSEKPEVAEQKPEVTEQKPEVAEQKTEVIEPKTDEKNIEKMETESEKVLPKEDSKTEESETKPEAAKELPADKTSEPVVEKVDECNKDSKEDKPEVKEEEKETINEVKEGETVKVNDDKAEVVETTSTTETEVSKKSDETEDSKSENTEEKKDKVETEEVNGDSKKVETEEKEKLNGVANGNKDGATNGTVANGHSKQEKEGIPDVIVSKNAPQIENGSADAGVAVEA